MKVRLWCVFTHFMKFNGFQIIEIIPFEIIIGTIEHNKLKKKVILEILACTNLILL